jgi:hypothetical protein
MIISDSGGTSFEQPPTGTHSARCISIIDLGTQRSTYEGEVQIKHQFVIRWELSNELMTSGDFEGKPFTVSKFYTASLHEKAALRKDLAAWRSRDFTAEELKGFDLQTILGKPCMLAVGLSEKGKAKVTSVMGLPKGMQVPAQVNPSFHFSLDKGQFKAADFEALSKGFKEMVTASPEYQQLIKPAPQQKKEQDNGMPDEIQFDDSDVPF